MNPKVNSYILSEARWQPELEELRRIILEFPLKEEIKWGVPCYTLNGTNVLLVHCFKEYCAILFHQGALLKDSKKLLIQQTENVQAARQLRFTNLEEIVDLRSTIKSYIKEAIDNEKVGRKVELKKTAEFAMPEEFQTKLEDDPALKEAFEKLTPGRQRGYLLYFSSAKQAKTRQERVEKYIPEIMAGKGLED